MKGDKVARWRCWGAEGGCVTEEEHEEGRVVLGQIQGAVMLSRKKRVYKPELRDVEMGLF